MNKLLMILIILLTQTLCFAEKFICYDATSKQITSKLQGDCKTFGLCSSDNNIGLQSNCIFANDIEWNSTGKYMKVDTSMIDNRIVSMTQVEKDALDAIAAQAVIDAKNAARTSLDDKLDGTALGDMTLTKIDKKIDAINNLTQATSFLKLLVRAIVKLHGGE